MIKNTGKFITFEGGEGSGKSTQSKLLVDWLNDNDIKAIHTREVGGTKEAEKIRDVLVYNELKPLTELMLVMAARFEHLHNVIIPNLNKGIWVVCDRFIDSTAAYQSGVSGLSMNDIYNLHHQLMNVKNEDIKIMPDISFFMDISPELGLDRAQARGEINKFDDKNITFHNLIYQNFKKILTKKPKRFINVECLDKTIQEINLEIQGYINVKMENLQ